MKFMKLGSKPDQFQTDGDSIRYVATELSTDIVISVEDVKYYLHKFPLLSKSSRLQKLVANTSDATNDEINIHDIPGGPVTFEICAKFCYGMVTTLNAYNVVAARCAAEYLEMYETLEKGNLIYKIDVFLTSSIFRSWKDSIIVLQTTKSFLPWSDELKIISHCIESLATKASIDPSKVDWSYTYNHKKSETELRNGVKMQLSVPKDWWVEDLCELQLDFYKPVITTIQTKGRVSADVIGESLKAYSLRRLPVFKKGAIQGNDILKYRFLVETITFLLPEENKCVPCGFLLTLLQASIRLECGETGKKALIRKIAEQLDEAIVSDLLIHFPNGETTVCDIDMVHYLVGKFLSQDSEFEEIRTGCTSDGSKSNVARLVDGYLAEAARDPALTFSKFVDLAEMVSGFPRLTHDGIYRAIDMYLKEHPELTKSEKKKICRLMDCRKLSPDACAHAVQNERLPLRVVVQVLFFEQGKTAAGTTSRPEPNSITALLAAGSYGSSRSATTNTDEDWDSNPRSQELKALRQEIASLKLRENGSAVNDVAKSNAEKVAAKKVKKIFSRLWSNKERSGENSSSDTSDSPASTSAEKMKINSLAK